jgi:hypothetical protein
VTVVAAAAIVLEQCHVMLLKSYKNTCYNVHSVKSNISNTIPEKSVMLAVFAAAAAALAAAATR